MQLKQLVVASMLAGITGMATAQTYPARPITILC